MIHRRSRFPYEWQVALSGALLVGVSALLPSTPFSGLLSLWARWIGEPLLGWHLVGAYSGFVFLPPITALALAYPLLALSDQVLGRPRRFSLLARTAAVLLLLLSGMAVVDAALTIGMPLGISQIAVDFAIGIVLVMLGIRLYGTTSLSFRIRMAGISLVIAGACIGSFVLLPVGLIAFLVVYIVLAIVLGQREIAVGQTGSSPVGHR